MLHWKTETEGLIVADLDEAYNTVCAENGASNNQSRLVIDLIFDAADLCLQAGAGLNLENKVVLSIAIRMKAEMFIFGKLNDAAFLASITGNQTQVLITKYKKEFQTENEAATILDRVALMTPENIHLNSFMYEPIIDMGESHLQKLYQGVTGLT